MPDLSPPLLRKLIDRLVHIASLLKEGARRQNHWDEFHYAEDLCRVADDMKNLSEYLCKHGVMASLCTTCTPGNP